MSSAVLRATVTELGVTRFGTTCLVTIVVAGMLPTFFAMASASSFETPFPLAFYALVMRKSPMTLTFGLLAALPYVLRFGSQVSQRYLLYTRTRESVRVALLGRAVACVLVTFATFVVIGVLPFLVAHLPGIEYDPTESGLLTDADVRREQATYTTFSQLTRISPWLYVLVFAAWLGVNASAYALLALAGTVVLRHRLLAFSLPWIVSVVAAFGTATLGLEAFSPDTILPFNVKQLPSWMPLVPFLITAGLAVAAWAGIILRADRLERLQ